MSTQVAAGLFIALAALNIVLDLGKSDPLPTQVDQIEGAR